MIQQLALPIIVPGRPPVLLASAWHTLRLAALDAEETRMRGRQINIDLRGRRG
ncbi:MAG: hypothetical protein M3464_05675 [Chloroflexota bacterium]|nr:hypothetical protein [Chloroflexota bacterium]